MLWRVENGSSIARSFDRAREAGSLNYRVKQNNLKLGTAESKSKLKIWIVRQIYFWVPFGFWDIILQNLEKPCMCIINVRNQVDRGHWGHLLEVEKGSKTQELVSM